MTKLTITRERLKEIGSDPMINQDSEFAMMARMAFAYLEMRDQVLEIAKCFLVMDDIQKIIRILNDGYQRDTKRVTGMETDIGKELESAINRLIEHLKSRTVTVSKSDIFNVPGGETYVGGEMISVDTLRLYLAEHGIKVEAE